MRGNKISRAFVARMQSELTANADKGKWAEWHPSITEARLELLHHYKKLDDAILQFHALVPERIDKIAEHSADLGNIASKIFDDWGTKAP